MKIIDTDDTGQLCFSYLSHAAGKNDVLKTACENFIKNANREKALKLESVSILLDRAGKSKRLSDEQLRMLMEMLSRQNDDGFGLRGLAPAGQPQ